MQHFLQLVPLVFWYIISGVPVFLILRRTGKSLWWATLIAIPIFGFVIVLWVLALSRWQPEPAIPFPGRVI